MDSINYLDFNDEVVKADQRLNRNRIIAKQSSFRSILDHWNNFRLKKLESRLEKKKEEIVNLPFEFENGNQLTSNSDSKMNKKVTAIAKLESKIKVLSKENVPTNYVKSRAIKLKAKMMENLWYNGRGAYTVGMENFDKVFGEEKNDILDNSSSFAARTSERPIDKNDVSNFITRKIYASDADTISPEEVAKVVGEDSIDKNNKSTVIVPFPTQKVEETESKSFLESVNTDAVRDAVNNALSNHEEEVTRYRTPSTKAKVDKYEEYGGLNREYNYVPMTDEEVEAARRNIGTYSDKTNKEQVRDESLVVPEKKKDLSFDYTNATKNDLLNAIEHFQTSDDLEMLKNQIAELRNGIAESTRKKNSAEEDVIRETEREERIRRKLAESEAAKNELRKNVTLYMESLRKQQEAIHEEELSAAKKAQEIRKMTEEHEGMIKQNDQLAKAYEEMIPEDARPKGK